MALNKSPYRGTRDFFPSQMRQRNFIFQKMAEVSELFAYEPYDGPILEEVELYLAKSGEELINEQIYSFIDRGDRKVAIRPEMTPTVARMAAQVHREISKPIRWYSTPNLMRYEKPQKGRLREFWQYNADIFGAAEYGEIEIIQLAVAIMKSFGATHEHFEIELNDRRVVDAIFKTLLGLNEEQTHKLYKIVDKVKKVTPEALQKMTSEVFINETQNNLFNQYLSLKTFEELNHYLQRNNLSEATKEFSNFASRLTELKLMSYVKFDPTIVRGLDYYTGIVFEVFDKHPDNRRAIAGGGAYANLLQIFNEPALPGVGFGLGDVTFTDFLVTHKLMPDFSKPDVDVLISYLTSEAEYDCFLLAERLREQGLRSEVLFGESKPKKVFSQSEKRNYKFVAMIGEEEKKNGEVQIKNLTTKDVHKISQQDTHKLVQLLKGNK